MLVPGVRVAVAVGGARTGAGVESARAHRAALVESPPDADAHVVVRIADDLSRVRVPLWAVASNVAGTSSPMLLSDDVALEYLLRASWRQPTALALLADRLAAAANALPNAARPSFAGVTVSDGALGGVNWTETERLELALEICRCAHAYRCVGVCVCVY